MFNFGIVAIKIYRTDDKYEALIEIFLEPVDLSMNSKDDPLYPFDLTGRRILAIYKPLTEELFI